MTAERVKRSIIETNDRVGVERGSVVAVGIVANRQGGGSRRAPYLDMISPRVWRPGEH